MEVANWCHLLTLFCLSITPHVASTLQQTCGPGVDTLGVTLPKGDIYLQYGQPLEIYCSLNPEKANGRYNSTSLFFSYDKEEIEEDYVTQVNATSIRLFMERPPRWKKLINCSLRHSDGSSQLVCLNYVLVGDKPQPLRNFSCVSYNWESLNCSWSTVPNFVPTSYQVSFVLKKTNFKFHYPCPDSPEKNYCVWNASSNPTYRLPYPHYYFLIMGNNTFGDMTQNIAIDHYASVLPHKPVNLSVLQSTTESLAITWAVPIPLHNFPPGLTHKIMYQSKYDSVGSWQTIIPRFDKGSVLLNYNITGLKYAHALYDVRVMMKPTIADDSKWSEPASITFHTNATVPGAAPKTDRGSFEIRDNGFPNFTREIFIYWQQIPEFLENGDNFEYKITNVVEYTSKGPRESSILPEKITKTFAFFPNISFNRHDFFIFSSNNVGYSRTSSRITVPSKRETLDKPRNFVKSSFHPGIWELNWKLDSQASSYTIFWCDNRADRPYECQGFLNWTEVFYRRDINDSAVYSLNVAEDKIYQIGLSANSDTSSSGLAWASCTLVSGKGGGKLKFIYAKNVKSESVEIHWLIECVRAHEGYQLHYCPIENPESNEESCREPEKTKNVRGDSNSEIISGLRPYTTYLVYFGPLTSPLTAVERVTTLEEAPEDPPGNVVFSSTNSSSTTISWNRPKFPNGHLRWYMLFWDNNSTRVESQEPVVHYTLTNLKAFTDYTIKVQACTCACSSNSTTVKFRTPVGNPGRIDQPRVRLYNKTQYTMEVTWTPPRDPAGLTAFYYVRVNLSDGYLIKKWRTYLSNDTKLEVPMFGCDNDSGSGYYYVEVRAVNIIDDNELVGPWSNPGTGNCVKVASPSLFPQMVVIISVGILAALAIGISVVYFIRYGWRQCKAMRNLTVKLPPQLELNPYIEKGPLDHTMAVHVCPAQFKQIEIKDIPPPDQQLLLDKKDKEESLASSNEDCEEGGGDQESSGCGSGHESVSSSITAGTHITDSGTEADERPSTPDVFGETPRRKVEARQQRNLSLGGSGGEGYSILAVAPPSNSGYVTVAATPASRGYVSHPPIWSQNPSKGYVTVGPPNTKCD